MSVTPPMTMMDFFRKSEGTWFSQRAVHNFAAVADESGESNLIVQVLDRQEPSVLEIASKEGIDPASVAGGAKFSWQGNLKDGEPNPNYAAILVDVPNPDNPRCGKFFRNQGYVEGIPVVGIYSFAEDGVLTIDTEYEKNQGQERCWFVTDDFRVRVSTVKLMNGVNFMTYSSERRCILPSQLDEMVEKNRQRALTA
ncbi:phycobiliprotein lyase [Mastigocoleus testarum]|uniref:Chromophore lyase CpcS/CpeS n=1 Tax=Mastigocoleus testarum BC008 TaxID=371196 RepID=A0A0V7ZI62_9CYAN|nr:phycobiliprotein lyase [Mastigocoleus testarum]KST64047.1 chorismate-binding protein [Mastigocoleus testarum BC008]KST64757.1 chorismate-binding protein [Mastigocoleus testarum BC008]